ncbi:MAG: Hsp20/alpha crystallin family protein [Lachnospiraceae bacterium]|nr:Hsp20/alpha crystallin family protein [Lachnospiraceae bacterium]
MLVPSIFEDNFMDDFFNDNLFSFPSSKSLTVPSMMQTDIRDKGESYELDISLPGYAKEDIKAELKNGYLTINAEHTDEKTEKEEGKLIRKERYTGHCSRSYYVGEDIREEDVKAKFENGELILEFPKEVKKPEIEEKKYISIA